MATYFDGEKLVNVATFSGSSSGTLYTVPAGRFARITIHSNNLSGDLVGHINAGSADVSIPTGTMADGAIAGQPYTVQAGTTIEITGATGGGNLYGMALEYTAP